MSTQSPLHPTLWRTCRVLANRTRLQILGRLFHQPAQTVSAVAAHIKQPLSVASESLRALEARGLLTALRVGRRVEYQLSTTTGEGPAPRLIVALRLVFRRESQPIETVFKLATAFTHPRRIDIFRVLQGGPRTLEQISAATGISGRALARHLSKLEARGFLMNRLGTYSTAEHTDALGRELARLAEE